MKENLLALRVKEIIGNTVEPMDNEFDDDAPEGKIYSLKLSLPQVIIMNISKFGIIYRKNLLFFSIQGTYACLSAVHDDCRER